MDAARLRRRTEIASVRNDGERTQHRLFAMRSRPNGTQLMRLAVAAPRSLGRAVARNRARRRVREALRVAIKDIESAPGHDLVVTARGSVLDASPAAVRDAARAAIARLHLQKSQ